MQIPFVLEEDEDEISECISKANVLKLNWLHNNNDTILHRVMLGKNQDTVEHGYCDYHLMTFIPV